MLLNSPKMINMNESTAFVKTLRPNQDKAETLSLLRTNAQIRMLSHEVMVLTV